MKAEATTGLTVVTEEEASIGAPVLAHAGWREAFPWLFQGTTWRGPDGDFDLGLFGRVPVESIMANWRRLMESAGFAAAAHSRQVHRARIRIHSGEWRGFLIGDGDDGHVTSQPGILLTVSVADCIPVSIVDEARRSVALVHAGWRGVAAGAVESGLNGLRRTGSRAESLHIHFGPAICGRCYEVGPEVHEQLGLPVPPGNQPIDLRALAADRAVAWGIEPGRISLSTWCTRCTGDRLFSHRGGSTGRQMGLLGIRAESTA